MKKVKNSDPLQNEILRGVNFINYLQKITPYMTLEKAGIFLVFFKNL